MSTQISSTQTSGESGVNYGDSKISCGKTIESEVEAIDSKDTGDDQGEASFTGRMLSSLKRKLGWDSDKQVRD